MNMDELKIKDVKAFLDTVGQVIRSTGEDLNKVVRPERAPVYGAAVWLDPTRIGGKPCIYGHRLSTRLVAALAWEGRVAGVQSVYPQLTEEEILGACWYEVTYGKRKKWKKMPGSPNRPYADWPKKYKPEDWE